MSVSPNSKKHFPFWMPWGDLGCLWRVLVFFIGLTAFITLLLLFSMLFRGCTDNNKQSGTIINPNKPELPAILDSIPDNKVEPVKPINWPPKDSIPTNDILPINPIIPTPNPGDIIVDPIEKKRIDSRHLMIIINSNGDNIETLMSFCEQFSQLYPRPNYSICYYNPMTMLIVIEIPPTERDAIKQNLPTQITNIDFYVENIEIFIEGLYPTDPAFNDNRYSWQFEPIQAYEGWDITTGNPDVKVAIIDSFFDLTHPDFRGIRISDPISIERGTTDVSPAPNADQSAFCHGTHVAGIIAGQMNNNIYSCGISPNTTIMPISLGMNMNSVTLVEGVLYALYQGADVINVSIGSMFDENLINNMSSEDQVNYSKTVGLSMEKAWDYIYNMLDQRNCMIVWSAGNCKCFELMDNSKRNKNTIKVEAVDQNLNKAVFSNYGNIISENIKESVISAPGVDILSTTPYRTAMSMSGTSMAAPIVTGAVALMKSIDPTLTNQEIIDILVSTGKPLNDKTIGPLIQIKSALEKVLQQRGNWDEFKRNPIGIWKTTENFPIYSVSTREWSADVHQYLIFDSKSHGVMELHTLGIDRVYNGHFNVKTYKDSVSIKLPQQMQTYDGRSYIGQDFVCRPDNKGYVIIYQDGSSNNSGHYLKRIKNDDRKNNNKRNI
ncbi:S8 family serine peptidase [Bacteroides salyersiae]|uniref:S8 family serine peptidase n=1 Tax=Bacteroides salyersiae TaxID=291644 RepID=UPI001CCDA913|nr:S8 family serine peptidase [Bacteroides salyersiae]UBD64061.1 S8 family serine peptidase [Bacteroides salyersiae]